MGLSLLEVSSQTNSANAAIKAEWSRGLSNRVPVMKYKNRCRSKFREKGTNRVLHAEGEFQHNAIFEELHDQAYTANYIRQKRTVITETAM